jgi:hypothetical protein
MSDSLPISEAQAKEAAYWLKHNFEDQIREQIRGTFLNVPLICAIICKETAYKWIHWIDTYDANTILARCVFDASGEPEFKGSPRSAFPKNRIVFAQKYGSELLKTLVEESNKTRRMQGWHDAPYLYKGYGIFQYDLQNIVTDESFFRNKLWYNMSDCLNRLVMEMNEKARIKSNIYGIIKAYNGAGSKAEMYANDVIHYYDLLS